MVLSVAGLTKMFDGRTILDGADYKFEKGKIYGLLGRNGAGKTTMFNCITGNLTPDGGKVIVEVNGKTHPAEFDDIGYVFTQPHLPEFMTGYEFIKFFVDINKNKIEGNVNFDQVFEMIEFSYEDRHKLIRDYSHGMQNKLQILAFLILRPPVIFLDEPLTSFDVIAALQIKNLIKSIKRDHIIIFSTHIMELAQDLCDEIVILHKGKLSKLDSSRFDDKDFEQQIFEMLSEGPKALKEAFDD